MPMPGAVPASMGRRLLAYVVDVVAALLLGGAFVVAGLVTVLREDDATSGLGAVALGTVLLLLLAVGQWWSLAARGTTVGRRLVGLRVVTDVGGRVPGAGRAFVRLAVPVLAWVVPVLGPLLVHLSPVWDGQGRRRGWQDRLAGTVVLDVVAGADPVAGGTADAAVVHQRLASVLAAAQPEQPERPEQPEQPEQPAEPTQPDLDDSDLLTTAPIPAASHLSTPVPTSSGGSDRAAVPSSAVPSSAVPSSPTLAPEAPVLTPLDVGQKRVVPPSGDVLTAVPFPARPSDEDVEATRLRPARGKVPEVRPGELSATVELTDGQRITFAGTALVGRNPSARAGEEPGALVRVADPGRSVSKTHLVVGVDRNGVWVRDRASTNGTVVTLADGQQILCGAEQQVRVPLGATVAFGDYGLTVVAPR